MREDVYKRQAEAFQKRLEALGVRVYRHYPIPGYPYDIAAIVSDEGYGRNEYIETSRSLVVVTAPGPGSGKMATCLSQLYHDNKCGIQAGYAKFETFPIWNLPLRHPVNMAYEAATADLDDVNMIDPYHLEAYGKDVYKRQVEQRGLFYPPDPGEKSATIGGNISTNAGGMRAVKYGVTRDYVRALEVVLPDGKIVEFGGKVAKDVYKRQEQNVHRLLDGGCQLFCFADELIGHRVDCLLYTSVCFPL